MPFMFSYLLKRSAKERSTELRSATAWSRSKVNCLTDLLQVSVFCCCSSSVNKWVRVLWLHYIMCLTVWSHNLTLVELIMCLHVRSSEKRPRKRWTYSHSTGLAMLSSAWVNLSFILKFKKGMFKLFILITVPTFQIQIQYPENILIAYTEFISNELFKLSLLKELL